MRTIKPLLLLSLMFFAAACGNEPGADAASPEISFNNRPTSVRPGNPVNINVSVDGHGIALPAGNVRIIWNDGSKEYNETMTGNPDGEWEGSFTPSVSGDHTYYVSATDSGGRTGKSTTVKLTVSQDAPVESGDPETKLRLSEIGTSDGGKFIEIYNMGDQRVSLGDVSIYKNGVELFRQFKSTDFVSAGGYGVLFGKGAKLPADGSFQNLGTTESGLSGSKSLLVELRYENGATTIDAFANTRNPDVKAAEWDDEAEREAAGFLRKTDGNGWYASNGTATPGHANSETPDAIRLRHQYLTADAMPDMPYIRNVRINPGSGTPEGITAGLNEITVEAYTDIFSDLSSVGLSVNGVAASPMTLSSGHTFTGTASFTGPTAKVTVTADNGQGHDTQSFNVTVFSASTTFAAQSNIRLNEINTDGGDFIELYNTSPDPVVIAGMRIRKNKDRIFTVPGYMAIKGNGYAVLGCNDRDYSGDELNLGTVPNGLSGSKSLLVELRKPKVEGDDDNSSNIDSFVNITKSVSMPDKDSPWDVEGASATEHIITGSAGRRPDGSGSWYVLGSASAGTSNAGASQGAQFTQSYNQ